MAKKHRHTLGLHTQEEQDRAFEMARKVFRDARKRILEHDDRDALLFGQGYLNAVKELAASEGADYLAGLADQLLMDLERAYHGVQPPVRSPKTR